MKSNHNHSDQAANNINDKKFKNEEEGAEEEKEGAVNNRYSSTSPPLPELISNENELDSARCLSHERLKPIARRASFDIADTTNNQRHHPYAHSHSRPSSSTSIHPKVTVKEEDNSRRFGFRFNNRRLQRNTSPPEYYLSNYSIKQRIPINSISPPPSTAPLSTKYQVRDRMPSSSTIQNEYHPLSSVSPPCDQKPILSPRHTPFTPYRRTSSRSDLIIFSTTMAYRQNKL